MSLFEIIGQLIATPQRATHELPRGLWLVSYPATADRAPRLVAGRHRVEPSARELATVREHLLEVLDAAESQVVSEMSEWVDATTGDWNGAAVSWHMLPVAEAFSPDPERAEALARALERRDERIEERRKKQQAGKPKRAGKTAPIKDMF